MVITTGTSLENSLTPRSMFADNNTAALITPSTTWLFPCYELYIGPCHIRPPAPI